MKIFFLSRENIRLSKAELESFLGEPVQLEKNLGFAETKKENFDRLAMSKTAGILLFACKANDIIRYSKDFPWENFCNKDFCVETKRLDETQVEKKKIAGIVHERTGKPAKMNEPEALIEIFLYNEMAYVTKRIWVNTDDFNSRKAHNRPASHPTSTHPKLSKAMVNLTGVHKGTIVDPFCGSGGILLEAGLMRLCTVGYDISEKMLEMCRINLEQWKVKDYELKVRDALTLDDLSYIVTDPPYGRNTTPSNLEKLYQKFLHRLKIKLRKRAVVVFPDFFDYKRAAKNAGLKIIDEFDWYVHKSMTRNVVILEAN
mgnify:CR=1 FL=1